MKNQIKTLPNSLKLHGDIFKNDLFDLDEEVQRFS